MICQFDQIGRECQSNRRQPRASGSNDHQAAAELGVSRKTLSLLLDGHAGVSPEMAIRLPKGFGRTPESWLQLQMQYDLAQLSQQSERIQVKPFARPENLPTLADV